ncbi:MAG: hypothetical protein PHY56_05725, partial [Candidatus Omnitrophica bacterium]|nr:hypothetical protein [Candidatus Omnitrophota bacterium]
LVNWIKHNYPSLEIKASIIANIDSLSKAKQWESRGADSIVLGLDCNRDFALLANIVKNIKCTISLVVNLACLRSCALSQYHYVLGSHASQSKHKVKHFFIDYCMYFCSWLRFSDLSQIIRSGWIRPEDLPLYEDIGIRSFKIVGRILPTPKIVQITRAYVQKQYDGNLLELLAPFSGESEFTFEKFLRGIKYILRFSKIKLSFLREMLAVSKKKPVFIDNRSLDGFLEAFRNRDCRLEDCSRCRYCLNIAERVVKIDPDLKKEMQGSYRKILDALESGAPFK